MAVIVVGVDHSEGAKAALRFALEEATLRQATLRVVHAWQYAYIGATGFEGSLPALGGDIKELRDVPRGISTRRCRRQSRRRARLRSSGVWWKTGRQRHWSMNLGAPTWSWSARADTAASPACCSARSASKSPITRPALS